MREDRDNGFITRKVAAHFNTPISRRRLYFLRPKPARDSTDTQVTAATHRDTPVPADTRQTVRQTCVAVIITPA